MDGEFERFYKGLDERKFKYFVRGDVFYVYNSDVQMLPEELRPKGKGQSVKMQNIDKVVRDMLVIRKIAVEEYLGHEVVRRGYPEDYRDFMDICVDEEIVPTVFGVDIDGQRTHVAFIMDSKIMRTEFEDDDMHGRLHSIASMYNCIEVLYNDERIGRVFEGWGIPGIKSKQKECEKMIMEYMKIDFVVKSFEMPSCCMVDIRDFDLVDFGLKTRQGKRLLNQWLRGPSTDKEEIERRLDICEAFSKMNVDVNGMIDMKRIVSRIDTKRIGIGEISRLMEMVEKIPELIERCGKEECVKEIVEMLRNAHKRLEPVEKALRAKIDVSRERINPELTEELMKLNLEKEDIYRDIEIEYEEVKKIVPKVRFVNKCFRIPRSEYNQNVFETKEYTVVSLIKTGTYFTTRNLTRHKNHLEEIERRIEQEEGAVVDEIRNMLKEHTRNIEQYNHAVALIDMFVAFSTKVRCSSYCRPRFDEKRYELWGMFHPVLEKKGSILNDIVFEKNLCILTGPNMGGKSTFIRTLSMVSLYAQIGCYVPARQATLPVFDRIYLRIGAKDYSSQGLSTYMVEMKELSKILKTATNQSLVLIDELGRGTSAIDGMSLVQAVKEYWESMGTKTVMATHYSEIGDEKTMNKRMGINGGTLTYKIEDGICNKSFGLTVAEMAGFPEEVIGNIRKYMAMQ